MALITAKETPSKEKIKLDIDQEIHLKINKYCSWAGIPNIEHFFEESANYIFSKDKDWIKYLKSSKKKVI